MAKERRMFPKSFLNKMMNTIDKSRGLRKTVKVKASIRNGKKVAAHTRTINGGMKHSGKEYASKEKKWHPDQYGSDTPEDKMDLLEKGVMQTKESGVWKVKAGQDIGYLTGNNKIEKAKVHGFGKESGGAGRRALHISTKKGHLLIDPFTNGHTVVDLPKNSKKELPVITGFSKGFIDAIRATNKAKAQKKFPRGKHVK